MGITQTHCGCKLQTEFTAQTCDDCVFMRLSTGHRGVAALL